ncbi:hypothetical protein AMATHDRAFT_11342 [Amanita thiersii Skay4041]|uniref:Uncharacterized protein n=1 Tax=Amanita thiersii Skay4041 TaxID=703135 RepID=A0A2A9NA81_9AGAR|nr:hypothetical protein AMATHDRAFT_11342 [Amanita thiersii Skay4041]
MKLHEDWMRQRVHDVNTNAVTADYVIFMDGSHNPDDDKATAAGSQVQIVPKAKSKPFNRLSASSL